MVEPFVDLMLWLSSVYRTALIFLHYAIYVCFDVNPSGQMDFSFPTSQIVCGGVRPIQPRQAQVLRFTAQFLKFT